MDELLSPGAGRPGSASREIRERIRVVFADSLRVNSGEEGLTYQEMLDEAASLDSIAVLEFLTAVEKAFGVKVEPAILEFEFLRDVEALASYIEDRISRPSGLETDERARAAANPNE
jgi:acyl carrier protein